MKKNENQKNKKGDSFVSEQPERTIFEIPSFSTPTKVFGAGRGEENGQNHEHPEEVGGDTLFFWYVNKYHRFLVPIPKSSQDGFLGFWILFFFCYGTCFCFFGVQFGEESCRIQSLNSLASSSIQLSANTDNTLFDHIETKLCTPVGTQESRHLYPKCSMLKSRSWRASGGNFWNPQVVQFAFFKSYHHTTKIVSTNQIIEKHV